MTLFDFPARSGEGSGWPEEPDRRRSVSRWLLRVSLVLVVIVAVLVPGIAIAWGIFHQRIADQIAVWTYSPTPEIAQLAGDSGMNDEGRFYFYASAPTVENAADFTAVCGSSTDDFVLLGCYTGTSIHVFDVADARLAGIRTVTAAHEMLHAVYARLSDTDRDTLDAELEAQYETERNDPELAARMQSYAASEPGERDNELHSIFGTEVDQLSPELQQHYAAYFADRSKVVAQNTAFEAVFAEVQAQEKALADEVTASGDAIDAASTSYSADLSDLNSDIDAFNERADAGDFSSERAFTAARNDLLTRGDELNARYDSIEADIAHYNDLRTQLEAVDSQASELNRSIDSSLQAPSTTAPAPGD